MTQEQFDALKEMIRSMIAKALDANESADQGLYSAIEENIAIDVAQNLLVQK